MTTEEMNQAIISLREQLPSLPSGQLLRVSRALQEIAAYLPEDDAAFFLEFMFRGCRQACRA